ERGEYAGAERRWAILTASRVSEKGRTMAGNLDVKTLEEMSHAGEIDTVLCMFTDLQGRYMGKRVVPHFFLEEILGEEGLHACLYLLAIDMEMDTQPSYQ